MSAKRQREVILAYGHQNIQASHKTTLEITRDRHLTKKGDCIIAVAADKALTDLGVEFKESLRKPNAKLVIMIEAGGVAEKVVAHGCERLSLADSKDIVVRKSDYVCSRTLAVQADKAACELSPELVLKLKNPEQRVKITLETSV